MKKSRIVLIVLTVLFLFAFVGCSSTNGDSGTVTDSQTENNTKQPSEYTWEEYEALSDDQQAEFQKSFADIETFDSWLSSAQANAVLPWENGGKQPSEYTLEEYEALSDFLKDAFFESFEDEYEFSQWLSDAKGYPWDDGGKLPSEYTWEEYEALTDEAKGAFQKSFADITDFDAWLTEAQANASRPWENGGKQPSEYTWEEYEALSDFLKDAFFESFENIEDFDEWFAANEPK